MFLAFSGILQAENVLMQARRFKGKLNVNRPKPPHYERALFEAVTSPVYPKKYIVEECRQKQLDKLNQREKEVETHPFQTILANELRELFDSSKMILFCHRNAIKSFDVFNFRVALHRKEVSYQMRGKKTVRQAIGDTKFKELLPLLDADSCMLFSPNTNIADVLKILKKTPQIILLAGVIDDRILSRNQLEEYAKLGDLDTMRAQFAASLYAGGNQIVNNLQSHQSNLCYLLDAHSKILSEGKTPEPKQQPEQSTESAKPEEPKDEK